MNMNEAPSGADPRASDEERAIAGKSGSRWLNPLALAAAAVLFLILAAAAFGAVVLYYPIIPRVVVMATGAEGGAYSAFGERYREIAARQGVDITVLHTRGSVENLAMLRYSDFNASIAFIQNGLTNPKKSPELVSLGTVAYEPLWIFYRGPQSAPGRLETLRGMRVSVGPTGSGLRKLALDLLQTDGIDDSNAELLPLSTDDAAGQLIAGDIGAAMLMAAPEAPAVQRLLHSPEVRLLSLTRADTYVALYPFLTTVVLPEGYADLAHDQPPADVRMVATKASLIVRRDVQSAVQYLLLEAAAQVHSHPGVFQKVGEFPAAEGTDLPLSENAVRFYKDGIPLLQSHLPLWLAVLVEQLAIALLPLLAVAYPLLKMVPAAYGWGVRRRISLLYGELKLLELALENGQQARHLALADLAGLENRARHLWVPTSFAPLLFALRRDIRLVRERIDQGAPANLPRAAAE
jgi:TRAP transporter TAXI family solute receptor